MAASKHDTQSAYSLFSALAQDLKTPLVRILFMAEAESARADIRSAARHAIDTIDAYTLSTSSQQTQLALQPISPAAVVVDAAYSLADHAKQFSCNVLITTPKKQAVILANRHVATTALTMMGRAFIESHQHSSPQAKQIITLASYSTKNGICIGVFTDSSQQFSRQFAAKAKANIGKALRPFSDLANGASSQLFIADQLVDAMSSSIRLARHGGLHGLVFDMKITNQLCLV
ncbi:hypothetical protein EB118_01310 [bacterium]|nr:hypothetical protein [bacterium]NBX97883.1 hypothetical protein [bacterium]NDC93877.1 hypothetical protein [bacterium]NDD82824.1 hypothetical protein [bacterium]NDG28727.1 hypothetical protein [bacterium]